MPDFNVQQELPNNFSAPQIGACISKRFQELIILPTEKCNFRCTYCYEDFAIGRMRESVQIGIENFMRARAPELSSLTLAWFGGEPLLASSVVLRLSRLAMSLSRTNGFALHGGTTTNGYRLTSGLAQELVSLKQDFFQVTLDGWREVHDATRRRADGKGTFEVIWANLLALRAIKGNFDCLLRLHVRPDNLESMEYLCQHIHQEFGSDERFRFNVHDIRDLGGEGGRSVTRIPQSQFRELVTKLSEIATSGETQRGTPLFDPTEVASESASGQRASAIDSARPYICYAAKPNSLLIRADGRLGKCTVALNDPRNDLGFLKEDGTIQLNRANLTPWIRGLQDLDARSLACPLDEMIGDCVQAEEAALSSRGAARSTIPLAAIA